MTVTLYPDASRLEVANRITLPPKIRSLEFSLNRGFSVESSSNPLQKLRSRSPFQARYRVTLADGNTNWTLKYQGKPEFSGRKSMGGMPQGTLSGRGVYLDGSSAWYPLSDLDIGQVKLEIRHPEAWRVLSVGRLSEQKGVSSWASKVPHDDLYLIGGAFTRHTLPHRGIDLSVWLLQDDRELAQRYLGLMGEYIDHYARLIGEYPFAKFAVVENPWQTGFGMPSFTLLGSRVLRLPFIPYTSLPHEILHNWLGNGIWIDYRRGNWSEGLTAYLADHWMKERKGQGAQHRLKSLQRYTNFATEGRDSPLLEFVSRHDDTSQAIGYDKSLMVFHMLRRELGDKAFVASLQRLWERHRFQRIGFEQAIETLLSEHPHLNPAYHAWLETPTAPQLKLNRVELHPAGDQQKLVLEIEQLVEEPLAFNLPVLVTLQDGAPAQRKIHSVSERITELTIPLNSSPLRVDIDPAFDVLRYLDPSEQAPALNRLLGGKTRLVLPGDAPVEEQKAWHRFAAALSQRYPGLELVSDRDIQGKQAEGNLLVLGWRNRFFDTAAEQVMRQAQRLDHTGLTFEGKHYDREHHAVVLVDNSLDGASLGVIAAEDVKTILALARKLPHYGSFGRMIFQRGDAQNLRRDVLSPRQSVLSRQLAAEPVGLVLPPEPVLGGTD